MSLTVAGIAVPQITAEVAAEIESRLDPSEIYLFDIHSTNHSLNHLPLWYPDLPEIRLNTLVWPTDAARFGTFSFVITDPNDLATFREAAFTADGPQYVEVIINDESSNETVVTTMSSMPPRPLFRNAGYYTLAGSNDPIPFQEESLWLVTLVDDRYFWWFISFEIVVTLGVSTWATLVAALFSLINEPVFASPIPAAYGSPSTRFTAYNQPYPLYFDALAYTLGMRVSYGLTGLVMMDNAPDSMNFNDTQLTASGYNTTLDDFVFKLPQNARPLKAGGLISQSDLVNSVPSNVVIWFGSSVNGIPTQSGFTITVDLASLAIPEYAGVTGSAATKTIVGDMIALQNKVNDPNPDNLIALNSYAVQRATDWYLWQLPQVDLELAGIFNWIPNAWNDCIIWTYLKDKVSTRVMRRPWNDRQLGNIGSSFSGCVRSFNNNFPSVNNFQSGVAQLAGKDNNDCAVWFNIASCLLSSSSGSSGPTLDNANYVALSSSVDLSTSIGTWVNTGLSLTVYYPGIYTVWANVWAALTISGVTPGQTGYISAKLVVNGAENTDSYTEVIDTPWVRLHLATTAPLTIALNLTSGSTIQLWAKCDVTGGGTLTVYEAKIQGNTTEGKTRLGITPGQT